MGKPIRVLHVLGTTALGGAESRIMDLYRNIDRTRVQFDFAVHTADRGFFDQEIEALGGHIYRLPRFRGYNLMAYQKAWRAFFAAHRGYACVHGHMTSTASVYLPEAKKSGVGLTLAHARSAGVDAGLKGILTKLLRRTLSKKADYCLAASFPAGEAVFGKKAVKNGLVHVVPNAIEAQRYVFDPLKREEMRAALGFVPADGSDEKSGLNELPHPFVIGHVGRFHPCKNHSFLLDIFKEVLSQQPDSRLLLLGEGPGMEETRQKAQTLGISDKVLFAGSQGNAEDYYQAMDCFVFPSLYEGLPGTVLEAQTAGLPCLIADTVTGEVKVTGLVSFCSLSEPAKVWARRALTAEAGMRRSYLLEIKNSGFDVKSQAQSMQRLYESGQLQNC